MTNWTIVFNCDGWFEDEELVFPSKEAAEVRLRGMGDELKHDSEVLWATDRDGDPVLVCNAEHWTLVARVTEGEPTCERCGSDVEYCRCK